MIPCNKSPLRVNIFVLFFIYSLPAFAHGDSFFRNELCLGNENYSGTATVNGGNYLFVSYSFQLSRNMALMCRVSSDLVPNFFDDILASVHFRFNTTPGKQSYHRTVSMFGTTNLKQPQKPNYYAGLRLTPFGFTGDNDNIKIEFLPFSWAWDFTGKKSLVSYEFINVIVRF